MYKDSLLQIRFTPKERLEGRNMYNMSQEEKEYLAQYDIAKYDRPSIAADMAVFSVMGNRAEETVRDTENYRKLPEKKLKILLIQRESYPYKERWALPGGFCLKGEEVCEAARRELFEETQVTDAYLQLAGVFGEEGRDPRGWIISHTFLALIDGEKYRVRGGSDAWDARWFEVDLEKEKSVEEQEKDSVMKKTTYRLRLTNRDKEEPIVLNAVVREERSIHNFQVKTDYYIEDEQGFAFDHAKLIVYALLKLRQQTETDGRIVFDLMPEYFTLTELQNVSEIILGKELLTANFRRKMSDYVLETNRMITGAGHRPAKLFKRSLQSIFPE
ncbi:MAG: NUDIX hydrolase [Lachnospiraceae bacterium]|nr:NUDIX hydrolase [Lachnospiraceae bacterium]